MDRRRGMLLLAVAGVAAAPLAARAEVSASAGQLLDFANYSSEPQWLTSFVNERMCSGTATLQLEWNLGAQPTQPGTYVLYASSAAPSSRGADPTLYCPTTDDANTGVRAGPISGGTGVQSTAIARNGSVTGVAAIAPSGLSCTEADGNRTFFICAHFMVGGTPMSSAIGRFVVQLAAPDAPVIASVFATEPLSLEVSWTRASGGAAPSHHFVAYASPVDPAGLPMSGDLVETAPATGTAATLSGLAPEQRYRVTVVAYSVGGNFSAESAPVFASTAPVGHPGTQPAPPAPGSGGGGCDAGGAGPLSLLAATALARALRRRKVAGASTPRLPDRP